VPARSGVASRREYRESTFGLPVIENAEQELDSINSRYAPV
jgi:hypothetical protein